MDSGIDGTLLHGDCLELMRSLPAKSVDLVFTSPPYENARTYGIGFNAKGQAWVEWAMPRFMECLRVCRGLVAWVVDGKTSNFRYSAVPILFMADLHRAGVHLRKPPIFHRVGIPGSGGPDWLRNDYEFIVCATNGGKLPWSQNTAMGHPPKWAPGGEMSYRNSEGTRRNQWGGKPTGHAERTADGKLVKRVRLSHANISARDKWGAHGGKSAMAGRNPDGSFKKRFKRSKLSPERGGGGHATDDVVQDYSPPVLANPGNVIHCKVGGGVMGSWLCHENEAPFPESLAEFFIRSFCPAGGIVLDPFCGSGTTMAVAEKLGRRWIGMDIRDSQVALSHRRIDEERVSNET